MKFQSLFCWKLVEKITNTPASKVEKYCFNPCFAGSWSRSATECWISGGSGWFQSLFCWKLVEKYGSAKKIIFSESVSILVLLEVGREATDNCCTKKYAARFQSLFCWKLVEKIDVFVIFCSITLVSILVLLEVGREVLKKAHANIQDGSFNPCFAGSWSRSVSYTDVREEEAFSFNPCFAGSWSRRRKTFQKLKEYHSFNPCFAGSWSRRIRSTCARSCFFRVSILVLLEVGREGREQQWLETANETLFQSLFCWKLVEKSPVLILPDIQRLIVDIKRLFLFISYVKEPEFKPI